MALFGPGDEVITHMPGWPTIVEQIKLAGATPVIVRTRIEDGFALDAPTRCWPPSRRARAASSSTRRAIRPARCCPKAEARKLAPEAARLGLWIVIDLCYETLIYDGVPHNLPKIFGDAMRDRLVLAGSSSKAYAMTGWRCGWLVGAEAGGPGGQRAAESLDVERQFDHAARGDRGADRSTGLRARTC